MRSPTDDAAASTEDIKDNVHNVFGSKYHVDFINGHV
jgi:hypothetical protein